MEDLACPNCGERFCLSVRATSTFELHEDGTDQNGDVEWDARSHMQCRQCGHGGTVKQFTIKGLDPLLAQGDP